MVETTIKFKYPKDISEVSVSQYMRWVEVVELLFKDGEENVNTHELTRQKISIFCNIPLSAVDMIPIEEVLDVSEHITKIINKEYELVTKFKLGDKEFRILPNFENMSFGEFVDASEYLKNAKDYNKLLSVFYREVEEVKFNDFLGIEQYKIKKYSPDDAEENAKKFLKIPADVVIGLTFFLLNSFVELQKIMEDYLLKERMEILLQLEDQDLVKNGDGSTASID